MMLLIIFPRLYSLSIQKEDSIGVIWRPEGSFWDVKTRGFEFISPVYAISTTKILELKKASATIILDKHRPEYNSMDGTLYKFCPKNYSFHVC